MPRSPLATQRSNALLADLSAGEKKWLTFGGALINRLKLTHVEKLEKPQKGERT